MSAASINGRRAEAARLHAGMVRRREEEAAALVERDRAETTTATDEDAIRNEVEYRLRTTAAYFRMRGKHGEDPEPDFLATEIAAATARLTGLFATARPDMTEPTDAQVEAFRQVFGRDGRDETIREALRAAGLLATAPSTATTEWGVRYLDGEVAYRTKEEARRSARRTGMPLVSREVSASAWTVAE